MGAVAFATASRVKKHVGFGAFYSHIGRPRLTPELMLRMLLLGYVFAIGSERQICSEA